MVEVDPLLDWVRFMDFEEAERYRIEVQQTWARSLGFFGRFIARHYSWFLAMFNVPAWRSATTAGAALFRMPVRTVEQKKQAAVSAGELRLAVPGAGGRAC